MLKSNIEGEFETTKEVLEGKIFSAYSSLLKNSELYSQLKLNELIKEVDFNIFDNNVDKPLNQLAKSIKNHNEDVKSTSNFIFDNKSDIQSIGFKNFRDEVIDLDDDGSFIDLQIAKRKRNITDNKYTNLFKLSKQDEDLH